MAKHDKKSYALPKSASFKAGSSRRARPRMVPVQTHHHHGTSHIVPISSSPSGSAQDSNASNQSSTSSRGVARRRNSISTLVQNNNSTSSPTHTSSPSTPHHGRRKSLPHIAQNDNSNLTPHSPGTLADQPAFKSMDIFGSISLKQPQQPDNVSVMSMESSMTFNHFVTQEQDERKLKKALRFNPITLIFRSLKFEKQFISWYSGEGVRRWKSIVFLLWAVNLTFLFAFDLVSKHYIQTVSLRLSALFLGTLTMLPLIFSTRYTPLLIYELSSLFTSLIFLLAYGFVTSYYARENMEDSRPYWDPKHILLCCTAITMALRVRFFFTAPSVLLVSTIGLVAGYFTFEMAWPWSRFVSFLLVMWSFTLFGLLSQYMLERIVRKTFCKVNLLHQNQNQLVLEKHRSEHLLNNIFPKSVISQLKERNSFTGKGIINALNATIIMTDIQGFTRWSYEHDSHTIISMLNQQFSCFDKLCDESEAQVEKISTVGDAYICVCSGRRHQRHMGLLALRMVDCMKKISQQNNWDLKIRLGVACGNIIAAVLGKTRVKYDLLGEVVNLCHFLESSGAVNVPHISQEMYSALRHAHRFVLKERYPPVVRDGVKLTTYNLIDTHVTFRQSSESSNLVFVAPLHDDNSSSSSGDDQQDGDTHSVHSMHSQTSQRSATSQHSQRSMGSTHSKALSEISDGSVVSLLQSQTDIFNQQQNNKKQSKEKSRDFFAYLHKQTTGVVQVATGTLFVTMLVFFGSELFAVCFAEEWSLLWHWSMIGQYASLVMALVSLLGNMLLQRFALVSRLVSLFSVLLVVIFLAFYSQLPHYNPRSALFYVIIVWINALMHLGVVLKFLLMAILFVSYFIMLSFNLTERPREFIEVVDCIVAILLSVVSTYLLEIGFKQSFRLDAKISSAMQQTKEQRERSERLLKNVLPLDIIEKLKNDPSNIVECCPEATVMFIDISNFEELMGTIRLEGQRKVDKRAKTLVKRLNDYFKHFDTLTQKFNNEKIKTHSSLYMVANVMDYKCLPSEFNKDFPIDHPQHVISIARQAQECQKFILKNQRSSGFTGRIGFHSGKCLSAVIGKRQFAYDIFGNTINTASRMMSNAEEGEVLCSQVSYEVLQKDMSQSWMFRTKTIHAKGLGEIKAHSLLLKVVPGED